MLVRRMKRGLESESSVLVKAWCGVIVPRRYIPKAMSRYRVLSEPKPLKTALALITVFATAPLYAFPPSGMFA